MKYAQTNLASKIRESRVCGLLCFCVAQMVFSTDISYVLYINLQGYVATSIFMSS